MHHQRCALTPTCASEIYVEPAANRTDNRTALMQGRNMALKLTHQLAQLQVAVACITYQWPHTSMYTDCNT
jgi:hypothetical protein